MSQSEYEDDFEQGESDSEKEPRLTSSSPQTAAVRDSNQRPADDAQSEANLVHASAIDGDVQAAMLASEASKAIQQTLLQAQSTLQELLQTHAARLEASAQAAEQQVSICDATVLDSNVDAPMPRYTQSPSTSCCAPTYAADQQHSSQCCTLHIPPSKSSSP
jgi:hypothetical protein